MRSLLVLICVFCSLSASAQFRRRSSNLPAMPYVAPYQPYVPPAPGTVYFIPLVPRDDKGARDVEDLLIKRYEALDKHILVMERFKRAAKAGEIPTKVEIYFFKDTTESKLTDIMDVTKELTKYYSGKNQPEIYQDKIQKLEAQKARYELLIKLHSIEVKQALARGISDNLIRDRKEEFLEALESYRSFPVDKIMDEKKFLRPLQDYGYKGQIEVLEVLAIMHKEGRGVKKEERYGDWYLEDAAEKGSTYAQKQLIPIYLEKKDDRKAIELFFLLAHKKDPQALALLKDATFKKKLLSLFPGALELLRDFGITEG